MDTVSFMKEAGVLSNKAMRKISALVDKLDTLSTVQLVDFSLMYSSTEMQSSASDTFENVAKLEAAIMAKQEEFTAEQFATICSVIAFDDIPHSYSRDSYALHMPMFLQANLERVEGWL